MKEKSLGDLVKIAVAGEMAVCDLYPIQDLHHTGFLEEWHDGLYKSYY